MAASRVGLMDGMLVVSKDVLKVAWRAANLAAPLECHWVVHWVGRKVVEMGANLAVKKAVVTAVMLVDV